MVKFHLPQLSVERVLGIGLGFTFLYAGISSFTDPRPWIGFFPEWTEAIAVPSTLLVVHGIVQVIVGAALAGGFMLRVASAIAALDLAAIIVFYGIDAVTFRDAGLLVMAAVLYRIARKDLRQ